MADQASPGCWAGLIGLSMLIERMRCDGLLIMRRGRGLHSCWEVGKELSGRVSREIETDGSKRYFVIWRDLRSLSQIT